MSEREEAAWSFEQVEEETGCRIIQGDCLECLRDLEDETADAFITDPPYCSGAYQERGRARARGQGLRSETLRKDDSWFSGDNMGTAGLCWLLRSMALESWRILKPGGSLLLFCDWKMVASLVPAIESASLKSQNLIVWDKGSMGMGQGFRTQHELILHFTKGTGSYFARDVSNVVRCGRVGARDRIHPTEKPVDLLEELVRVVSPPDGLVVDPFAGSGSSGEAARRRGRRWIGIERSAEFCRRTANRIMGARKPAPGLSLFEEMEPARSER